MLSVLSPCLYFLDSCSKALIRVGFSSFGAFVFSDTVAGGGAALSVVSGGPAHLGVPPPMLLRVSAPHHLFIRWAHSMCSSYMALHWPPEVVSVLLNSFYCRGHRGPESHSKQWSLDLNSGLGCSGARALSLQVSAPWWW